MEPEHTQTNWEIGYVNLQFSPKNEKNQKRCQAQSSEQIREEARWAFLWLAE